MSSTRINGIVDLVISLVVPQRIEHYSDSTRTERIHKPDIRLRRATTDRMDSAHPHVASMACGCTSEMGGGITLHISGGGGGGSIRKLQVTVESESQALATTKNCVSAGRRDRHPYPAHT
jgi:hypothetical protein